MFVNEKRLFVNEKRLFVNEKRLFVNEKRLYDGEKRMFVEAKPMCVNEILLYEANYSRFGNHYILIFYFKFSSGLAKDSCKGSNSL